VLDKISSAIEKARSGSASDSDFVVLHTYLLDPDDDLDRIYSAVSNYLEQAPTVDWSIAVRYVTYPEDPMISAAAISMGGIRHCPDKRFWDQVLAIAKGVDWDPENDARVQALLALHSMPGGCADARDIIRHNLLSDWESVRDSAAVAAQRCFGRRAPDVVIHTVSGRLIESVGSDVLNWLWPERETNQRPE
jgi:hypothetical protein